MGNSKNWRPGWPPQKRAGSPQSEGDKAQPRKAPGKHGLQHKETPGRLTGTGLD